MIGDLAGPRAAAGSTAAWTAKAAASWSGMAALIGMGEHDLGRRAPANSRTRRAREPAQMRAPPPGRRRRGRTRSATGTPASIMTRSQLARRARRRRRRRSESRAPLHPRRLRGAPSVTWTMVTPGSRGSCAPAPIVSSSGWATTTATAAGADQAAGRRARARKAAARSGALSGCSLATARMSPSKPPPASSSGFDAPAPGA